MVRDHGTAGGARWLEQPDLDAVPVSRVLDALADPARLQIAHRLAAWGETSCTSLGLPLSPSTISHHLRVLRESGLIATRCQGTSRLSHLRTPELERRFPGLLPAILGAPEPGSSPSATIYPGGKSLSVDHIVYAVPDLEAGVASIEERLGVRAVPGGRHEATGSHNALLGLGGATYLEIIAPDPTNPHPPRPRSFNLDQDRNPRLGGWATRSTEIDATVARARAAGYDPGTVWDLSRRRPDGVLLEWRLTRNDSGVDFVLPFVIDWGDAQHPSTTSPQGAVLRGLAIEHPEPDRIARTLAALGVEDVDVRDAPRPALVATIQAPGGATVELR